jgi:hypothetical protein
MTFHGLSQNVIRLWMNVGMLLNTMSINGMPKLARLLRRMVGEWFVPFFEEPCFYTFSQLVFDIYMDSDTNIPQSGNKLVLLDFLVPKRLSRCNLKSY